MSALLNKRLARSLWRTKLRLFAVVLMVMVGVFAGLTFGGYAQSLEGMYSTMQADDEEGANLADLWIDNRSAVWTPDQVDGFCAALGTELTGGDGTIHIIDSCEGRTVLQGTLHHKNDTGDHIINALWHGIPAEANADRVWMPEGYSEGTIASAANEIVIDAHVADALDITIGSVVELGVGGTGSSFDVVGLGYHPLHVLMAPEGSIFPPEPGQYVVGYLTEAGMAQLTGNEVGSSNTIVLDVEGIPSFDLSDTKANEGEEIDAVKEHVAEAMEEHEIDGRVRDRGQNEPVEIMRLDLEGAKRSTVPFTVMIAVIASITIVLSLQRLVQSQAKEIAVLRTLGVSRSSLMTGYLIAPVGIGAVGCALGALLGPWGMNGMLDFYEDLVGVPIIDRSLPFSIYSAVIGSTMFVVFLSGAFPAWKASRLDPLEVLSGQSEVRVGSNLLRRMTSWMPTMLGLSLRSSLRKPVRLSMTFIAVGISLMLFGSIQMMSAGLQENLVGGLEDRQSWDAQVYIMADGESDVIDWAEEKGALHELLIELPMGIVEDPNGIERTFSLVGLDTFTEGMRSVSLIEGVLPDSAATPPQVIIDEGSMAFLDWKVGEVQTVNISGIQQDFEIVGVSQGEMSRTVYFHRSDLGSMLGVNATAVYLQFPAGIGVDVELGELSAGLIERETLIDGLKSLLEQQTQILQVMMYLGLMFTVVVMFNTMIMNVAERDFELATLRVLGASTKSLSIMLLFESVLIGVVGGLVGIMFAYGGAVGLAASFSTWQFYVPIRIVPSVAYQLMGGVIMIAVAMTPIGVWRLRKMDLIEKVKDLSN